MVGQQLTQGYGGSLWEASKRAAGRRSGDGRYDGRRACSAKNIGIEMKDGRVQEDVVWSRSSSQVVRVRRLCDGRWVRGRVIRSGLSGAS